jgi:hypothetical protein
MTQVKKMVVGSEPAAANRLVVEPPLTKRQAGDRIVHYARMLQEHGVVKDFREALYRARRELPYEASVWHDGGDR